MFLALLGCKPPRAARQVLQTSPSLHLNQMATEGTQTVTRTLQAPLLQVTRRSRSRSPPVRHLSVILAGNKDPVRVVNKHPLASSNLGSLSLEMISCRTDSSPVINRYQASLETTKQMESLVQATVRSPEKGYSLAKDPNPEIANSQAEDHRPNNHGDPKVSRSSSLEA